MKALIQAAIANLTTKLFPEMVSMIMHDLVMPGIDNLIADAKAGFPNEPDLAPHAAEIAAMEAKLKAYLDAKFPTSPAA